MKKYIESLIEILKSAFINPWKQGALQKSIMHAPLHSLRPICTVKTMRVAFRILGGIVCLAILTNLISWIVLTGIHGGTAWNGKVQEGRYYVGSHSRYTEVSSSQYRFSRFQETSNSIMEKPLWLLKL